MTILRLADRTPLLSNSKTGAVCENNRCDKPYELRSLIVLTSEKETGGKNATQFFFKETEKKAEHVDTNLHAFQAFRSPETNSGVVSLSLRYNEEQRTTKRTDTLGEGGGRWW